MRVKHLPENTKGRDFVIGDLHDCYSLLMAEMQRVGFDKSRDRIISVGDLVDRGPESFKCLSLPYEPWFHAVRGNHEELMAEAVNGGGWGLWMANGGGWAIGEAHLASLRNLVNDVMTKLSYAIEVVCAGRRIGIIHAEAPGNDWLALETGDTRQMTWGRTRIKVGDQQPVRGIDAVIVGHTIVDQPITLGNTHYIDTAAFHTGRLTMINLAELAESLKAAA